MSLKTAKSSMRMVGEYEILQRLSHSELSTIYKAHHPATGLIVAVKAAGPEAVTNSVFRKRFEQEFAVASSLDHPNLVRALHAGCVGDTPYIVMEFVDGPSLGDCIEKQGRLPEAEAVRIITSRGGTALRPRPPGHPPRRQARQHPAAPTAGPN